MTMEPKHTPGPWALDDRSLVVFEADGGGPIALVGDAYPRGSNHPLENMRLIAAAPDLFGALRDVVDTARGIRTGRLSQTSWIGAEERATAALKKALGE